jgi:hypothetical protein
MADPTMPEGGVSPEMRRDERMLHETLIGAERELSRLRKWAQLLVDHADSYDEDDALVRKHDLNNLRLALESIDAARTEEASR